MDQTSYSDPDIIETINMKFIPVRVDIDERPDISERYNRGGFPTTAFLSDKGESVWGGTYIPPNDLKRVMSSILAANASGEIGQALERSRMQYLDISRSLQQQPRLSSAIIDTVFEDIFASYDVQHGGFGVEPKFPQPDAIDLLLERYVETQDKELAEAIEHALTSMTDGLYDKVEGGMFRYSVTRDWKTPHYEKMLEGNAGLLRNLVRAHAVFMKDKYREIASGIASYMVATLQDHDSGGFFGSQDADEHYYKLSCPQRRKVKQPEVIKAIYAGWNSEAASSLIEAGVLLREVNWVDAGKKAFRYNILNLWTEDLGLIRHVRGKDLYLFEDQVSFLQALISMIELEGVRGLAEIGDKLIASVERVFKDPEGGYTDVAKEEGAVGELETGRRSLVVNAKWAKALALYGAAVHRPELSEKAKEVVGAFTQREVQAHGVFASSFVSAWWLLERGARSVEVHGVPDGDPLRSHLWLSAKDVLHSGAVVLPSDERATSSTPSDHSFAVVCSKNGCSKPVTTASDLTSALEDTRSSQF